MRTRRRRGYMAVVAGLMAVAGLSLCLGGFVLGCGGPGKEVSAVLDIPHDAFMLNLNRLWGRLTQATGIEAEDATLEGFNLTLDSSGNIRMFNFQVLTRDRYFMQFGCSSPPSPASFCGARTPQTERLPYSSSEVPLDVVFAAFDRIGIRSLEDLLATGGKPVGLCVSLPNRDGQGHGSAYPTERAFCLERGGFVQLDPDDPRREFGTTDAVFEAAPEVSSRAGATTYAPAVCIIIPAAGKTSASQGGIDGID